MTPIDPHYLECARAALALRIEGAKSREERKELRAWLAEIEARAGAPALHAARQPEVKP